MSDQDKVLLQNIALSTSTTSRLNPVKQEEIHPELQFFIFKPEDVKRCREYHQKKENVDQERPSTSLLESK